MTRRVTVVTRRGLSVDGNCAESGIRTSNDDTSLLTRIIGCCPSWVWVLREPVRNGNVLAAIVPNDDLTIVAQILGTARAMASGAIAATHDGACREALGDGASQAIETLHVMEDNPTDALLGLVGLETMTG